MTGPFACPLCGTHYECESAREACETICGRPRDDWDDH